ncbi:MAG: NAD(P)/FAD-dependent oxidoreductase [Rhodanobacter sp.]|jgi:NADPH-dependent 2,4-dienoyl-CoA reductase/sulfur reductase-like enzyme|nr:NAD(P)/FAD-dependent oxidoreductase [Rhodanobacter sp.]
MMRRRDFLRAGTATLLGVAARRAMAQPRRPRVVVVGGGFAGSYSALALKRRQPDFDVALVDPDERYVACPLSNEVLVGLRTLDSLTITRAGLARAGVRFMRTRATAIDAQAGNLRLDNGAALGYDRLIVAPGIRFLWERIIDYDETAAQRMPHAWKAGAQTALLAAQLRAMRNGGIVAICVPTGLMRCPPGPYERASLIADFLKTHKPRSKVLIFDANNHFPRMDRFIEVWKRLYPGLIEWIPFTDGGTLVRVEVEKSMLYTFGGAHRVDVANVIPPQAPDQIAADAGLASGHGWCPVKPESFESKTLARVHVIGDACIADAMPKSASAAVSQARQCVLAVEALLTDQEVPPPQFDSVCYSRLAPDRTLAINGRFRMEAGAIKSVEQAADADIAGSPDAAERWYKSTVADAFGV